MADSLFSGLLIWRDGDDGREYLVIEYDSGEGTQIKFPGGTNEDHPGETALETVHRECRSETNLVMPTDPMLIWSTKPTRNRDGGGTHQKHFFLIRFENCAGEMRTDPLKDDADRLSPPFWRTKEELIVHVNEGGLFWSHRDALHRAEEFFTS